MEVRAAAVALAAALLAAGLSVPAQADATARVERVECVVPLPDVEAGVHVDAATRGCPGGIAAGAARFPVRASEDEVRIELSGRAAEPVGARAYLLDGAGGIVGRETFCEAMRQPLPDGAEELWVVLDPTRCDPGEPWDLRGELDLAVQAAFTPGGPASGASGCAYGFAVDDGAPRRIRRCADAGTPPVDEEVCSGAACASASAGSALVDVDRTGCGPVSARVTLLGGGATVCARTSVALSSTLPDVEVRRPSASASPPGGETAVGGCANGPGARVVVLGNGGSVCVETEVGGGGGTLGVDVSPCPDGTDPRVDVLGQRVRVCVRAHPETDPGRGPDVDPGDVDVDGDVTPAVDVVGCDAGEDPAVRWLGVGAAVCLETAVEAPSSWTSTCGDRVGGGGGSDGGAAEVCVGAP